MSKTTFSIKELWMEFTWDKYNFWEVYSRLNVINNNKILDKKLQSQIRNYKIISDENPSLKWIVRYDILWKLIWIPMRTQSDAIDIAKNWINLVKIYDKLSEKEKDELFWYIRNKQIRVEAMNSDIAEKWFFEKYFFNNERARNLLISKVS